MEYDYPLDYTWSVEEITDVINLYVAVEQAYEQGIESARLLEHYRKYTAIVDSLMAQKQYDKEFAAVSGYSIYRTIEQAKKAAFVKMEK